LQALRIVEFKRTNWKTPEDQQPLLNDLRTLRRLLLDERAEPGPETARFRR